MPSTKEYLDYVLDQLSPADGVSFRPMMGEYILYLHGKVIGGVYDNRFLVKITPASLALLPDAPRETPYPGAKDMLLAHCLDDREKLAALMSALEKELPPPKKSGRA